ncbi:BspA family leucine-rich repeat surface protein [Xylocopilactobacillus apis]|uniref:Surface protein n=1 Tax=Xylocopilactobacillus apis TaxID=2932183 RepID=A0AAU9DL31_9LACO|nr:BspA family leucine-rich repeat surface protein [Xylocopilactobacillus apis]BDR55493.1 hypothetical protein KIMC2_00550 [Xylocopilactobacillus apis]
MNKVVKRLGYLVVVLLGIAAIGLNLNNKQYSKASNVSQSTVLTKNNNQIGKNQVNSFLTDPLQLNDSLPKIQSQSKIQSRGAGQTPVSMGPGDSQNFFATVGSAVAKVNDDGTWDTISINEPKYYQVGAVTLNATVDMTKDFNFSWNLKIDRSSVAFLADGLGFIFHPLYSPGETITDLQGGTSYVLPGIFGRHSDTTAVTSATDPDNGQNIHSIGINGGDLGISDIMNAISFKIDTAYNGVMGTRTPNTPYGSPRHYLDIDRYPDDYYAGTTAGGSTNGSFVTTDNTGFSSASQYSAPLNGLTVTPKSDAFGSVSGAAIVVPDSTWRPMQIFYTAATHTLKVTIGDGSTGQVTWNKILNANEQAIIARKPSWAFSILGSTGAGVEGNTIKNIRGSFTPGDSVITTRYIDENGNDLQSPVSTLEANWQVSHPGSTRFTDSTSPATIVKNGKTYRRSQVNGTFFDNNTRTNKRLGAPGTGTTVNNIGSNVSVTTSFGNIIFINYIYRQELSAGSTDVTSDLQVSTDGINYAKTVNLHPGQDITFKYSAKNNNLPGVWSKVTAVQSLGGLFAPVSPLPNGVTQNGGLLYIPLNFGSINDLRPGETGTNTIKMKYQGVEKVNLTANDTGQITVTSNPATPGTAKASTVVSKVSIYDQSNQLIDDNGAPIYGSYFYNAANTQAPLANTDTRYNTANYIPTTDSVTVNDQGWWDYNPTSKVLNIYPHRLNAYNDAVVTPTNIPNFPDVDWPWKQYSADITKVVINPGVTSSGSVSHLFNGLSAVTEFVGLNNLDLTNATDLNSLFAGCSSIESLDLSIFNTPNVTIMYRLVQKCTNLKRVTFGPNFITSNVDDFSGMFEGDKSLTDLDVSHFDTSKAENTYAMFSMCESLEAIDVSHFDMSHVTNANWMFLHCLKLKELDTSNFVTSSLTNMQSMFSDCPLITHLDLSKFDVSNVTDMSYLFEKSSGLTELDLSSFNIKPTANTLNMFNLAPPSVTEPNRISALWKLTLGSGTKLGSQTLLPNPKPGTAINDIANPVPPNPQYYATNAQWREALTPTTVHAPTGAAKTAAQIATDSLTNTSAHTYVWDQNGTQTLAAAPGNINFGTHAGYLKNKEYKSASQNLKVTDNRNVKTGKRWHVEAAVTSPFKLSTNSTKVIRGNPLYHRNTTTGVVTHLLPTAQTLHSGTATSGYQDVKNYPWTLSFKAQPSDIPRAGRYNATVTFTLINDTP